MRKLFFAFMLAALILAACSGTSAPTRPIPTPYPARPTPNAAELKISDPAKAIEVAAANDFTITIRTYLPSHYHWEMAEALDDGIEYVWKHHVPDDPGNPNSSGRDVWRFKAIAHGKTTITLGYYQGMTDYAPKKLVFTIVVK